MLELSRSYTDHSAHTQFCAGVKAEGGSYAGAVHACLRSSKEHLSPECRTAEEAVEAMEHEDVRLNPRIQK